MSDQKNTMWGGRFATSPDAVMQAINVSVEQDKRFAFQDIAGSRAHAAMLKTVGVLSDADEANIQKGLTLVEAELENGTFPWRTELEDVHLNVEARLKELVGEAAGRVHTGRSRNDQVATDFRLWVMDTLSRVDQALTTLQVALIGKADRYAASVMPGFTHLQTAQPVTFGHHLMAYVEMFERDRTRMADARVRTAQCPLGAAALAGTSFPIDRDMTARALGFSAPMNNSLDAVSARDFALEAIASASICAQHLSRLAEEIFIWMSAPFSFVRLSDRWTTGSSIMPQKRNPDAAELVRAKCGAVVGAFVSLMTVMKGLPLAYSKDMQDDKPPVFAAFDALELSLAAMTGMVADMEAREDAMRRAASKGFSTATDLADWLVRVLNMPFRDAHHVTGTLVAKAEAEGRDLADLSLGAMQSVEPRITSDIFDVLSVDASVNSRTSYGGTAPVRVREQIATWRERLTQRG